MRKSLVLPLVALAALAVFAGTAYAQTPPKKPDIVGTWLGTAVVSEDGTQIEITVIISKTEAGYVGKISDASGMVSGSELRKIVFTDSKLSCEFDLAEPSGITLIQIEMALENDTLKGIWSSPEGDSGTIEIKRQR